MLFVERFYFKYDSARMQGKDRQHWIKRTQNISKIEFTVDVLVDLI